MKKLAAILAVALAMAIVIPLTGCGSSSSKSAVVTYVARPNSGGSYPPQLYALDVTAKTSSAVSIPVPATAAYVSANSDATEAVYNRSVGMDEYIFLMGTDGTEKQLTATAGDYDYQSSFSPDGKTIVYVSEPSASNEMIVTMNTDGTNQKTIYTSPGSTIYRRCLYFHRTASRLSFTLTRTPLLVLPRCAAMTPKRRPRCQPGTATPAMPCAVLPSHRFPL